MGWLYFWTLQRYSFIPRNKRAIKLPAMTQNSLPYIYSRFEFQVLYVIWTAVESPSCLFGNDQSVVSNSPKPQSLLKTKSSFSFHFVHEWVVKDEWRTINFHTNLHPADILVKSLPGGKKSTRHTSYIFIHYFWWNMQYLLYTIELSAFIAFEVWKEIYVRTYVLW